MTSTIARPGVAASTSLCCVPLMFLSFEPAPTTIEGSVAFVMNAVTTGVLFSAGIGVFFGMYPAWRASRLDPIDALRHE